MPPLDTSVAFAVDGTPQQLTAIDDAVNKRRLILRIPDQGAIDLANHVQGIARIDHADKFTLVCSRSGPKHGALWFGQFSFAADKQVPGRRCPSEVGETVATLTTSLAHPGGIQASGSLLAVACDADAGYAQVDIYDVSDPRKPRLRDTLPLDNSQGGGVSQLSSSRCGWTSFARVGTDEYLLFVGGRSYAQREGWFYRYTPHGSQKWHFEGNFTGTPSSSSSDAWGPQHGAALVRTSGDPEPCLITFGTKGTKDGDEFRARLRCFALRRPSQGSDRLFQLPNEQPRSWDLASAKFQKLGINPRWGSTALVEDDGRLVLYITARNPRPSLKDKVYELEIAELTARLPAGDDD
jgi:hypothetical protein